MIMTVIETVYSYCSYEVWLSVRYYLGLVVMI